MENDEKLDGCASGCAGCSGCGHDHAEHSMPEGASPIITLTDDEGKDVEFEVLDVVALEDGKEFLIVTEVSQEDIERFNKALGKYSKKLFGIWTIEDLKSIGNSEEYPLDGIYIQFEDITIGEEGISPIGTVEKPFTGIYNGNGKKIEELNIKAEGDNIGLFGVNSGKIENVTVEGYNLEVNYAQTGTIAGENSGIITKCINNNGEIHSNGNNDGSRVGGIVGLNKEDGLVEGCTNNSNISGEYKLVGGIVGYSAGSKFGETIFDSVKKVAKSGTKAVKKVVEFVSEKAKNIKNRVIEGFALL